jgi:hypothetical protein
MDIYAAGPSLTDVRALLGDNNWWPGAPTFGVRPLNATSLPLTERFNITQRFFHVGTAEHLLIDYTVWDSTSTATTEMTNIQTSFGTPDTGAKAGDQTFYYGRRETSGSGLFVFLIFTRVGQVLMQVEWTRVEALPDTTQLGKIATKLAARTKDVLAGKLHAIPLSAKDSARLVPLGNDLTLLGAAKLPIEAVAAFFPGAAPDQLIATFTNVGVKDFIYGDYALDVDVRMEVRTSEFAFSDPQEATTWIDTAAGAANLDANGVASAYVSASGIYFWIFTAGVHGAIIFCSSAVAGEAASRACEVPVSSVITAWHASLAAA